MKPNNTEKQTAGDILKNWWIQQGTANNQETLKKTIRMTCGWNRDVWYNKIQGRTEISHLEQMAINKVTKHKVFEINSVID